MKRPKGRSQTSRPCPKSLSPFDIPKPPTPPPPLLPPDHRPNPALALDDDRGLASRHRCRTSALFDSCACRFLCGPKTCNSCSIFFNNSPYSLSGKRYPLLQRRIWTTEAPYTISSSRLPTNQVPRFFWFSLLATTKELQVFLFPSRLETG